MVVVEFLGPIARQNLEVNVTSLRQLSQILKQDESLNPWLEICAVAVNDNIVQSIDFELKDGDKISILPPVCGG